MRTLTINELPVPPCPCTSKGRGQHWAIIDVINTLGRTPRHADIIEITDTPDDSDGATK